MSVSTKLVTRVLSPREVKEVLEKIEGVADIRHEASLDSHSFIFLLGRNYDGYSSGENRILHVFQDLHGVDYGFPCSTISLNVWGHHEEIMHALHTKFKGFYCPNDCDDIWNRQT